MNTKRWIALAIVAVVVVGSLGLIKLFPFWATLACLVSVIAGFAAGYLFKRDIIKEVEKVVEVVKEAPVKATKKTVKKA
jgi:membrane protein DedA with SNARE-associated domain